MNRVIVGRGQLILYPTPYALALSITRYMASVGFKSKGLSYTVVLTYLSVRGHSVEGAVAKVLVEREGEGQPPLPAAQPHVPDEVRVRGVEFVLGPALVWGLG